MPLLVWPCFDGPEPVTRVPSPSFEAREWKARMKAVKMDWKV